MGFKKTNYYAKHIDVEFSEAYAIIKNIRINGNSGVADFVIQTNRDKAMFSQPIETVKVYFEVDRNESPYITAYKKAKESKEMLMPNPLTGKLENTLVKGEFADWEDDNLAGE